MHRRFNEFDLIGNSRCEKLAMEVARLLDDEVNGCRFDVQREEHWVNMRPTWLKGVREKLLDFFVTKPVIASICSGIGYDTSS